MKFIHGCDAINDLLIFVSYYSLLRALVVCREHLLVYAIAEQSNKIHSHVKALLIPTRPRLKKFMSLI